MAASCFIALSSRPRRFKLGGENDAAKPDVRCSGSVVAHAYRMNAAMRAKPCGCSAIGPAQIDRGVTAGAVFHIAGESAIAYGQSTSWTTPSAFETDFVAEPHSRGEMGVHPASASAAWRQHRRG